MSTAKHVVVGVLAAAGTALGGAAMAAAQSAIVVGPESKERKVEIRELRKGESPRAHVENGEWTEDGEVRVFVHGQEGARATVRPRVHVEHGEFMDDGEVRVFVHGPGQGGVKAAKPQQRVMVRRHADGDGEVCESCGQAKPRSGRIEGGNKVQKRVTVRGLKGHGEGGPHVIHGDGGAFGLRGVGPDQMEWKQFFGEGEGGKVQLRRFEPGEGGPFQMRFFEGGKAGQDQPEVHIQKHVVIVGPDGQKREWRSGDSGGEWRRLGGEGKNDVQIFEFRDGGEGGPHLFVKPGQKPAGKGGAQPRKLELRRNMNVI